MDLDLIDRFLVFKESSEGKAVSTVNKYRYYLIKLTEWLDKPIEQATRAELITFCGEYAYKGMRLSPTARKPLVSAVRGFYSWACINDVIQRSPADSIPYPKTGRRLPVAMGLSNAERILMMPDMSTFIGVRDAAILMLMIGCGPRVSGVVRLNQSDLIWDKDSLSVRFTEKGNRQRLVPVHEDAMWMIRAYLGHEYLQQVDCSVGDGDKVLFITTANRMVPEYDYYGEARRMTRGSIHKLIVKYGVMAGVDKSQLHAHALRHLFGAELSEAEVDILVMQALLGHADPKTTEIYSHIAVRRMRKASDKASPLAGISTPTKGMSLHSRAGVQKT